ncbi:RNA-binding domain-containing protein [Streptomyces sp. SM10]|uniref:RNA-binding domain-containing protein n=1 Tax=Streptomyces sp. SM10 TaxID=565556 RepID=UPI0011B0CA2C|nr:RNA-binding domain-containing protein [Streptomyces sp. SM10]
MVAKSIEDVRRALHDRVYSELLGTPESVWLDVKSHPYQLKQPSGAEELVKDVAAFANAAGGGLLLVGFKTVPKHDSEIISELRPVPRSQVNIDQYRKLIHERITPTVRALQVEWIDCGDESGILCIDIPAQPAGVMPFVVPGPSDWKGRPSGTSIAVPLRTGDGTQWLPRAELQGMLVAGWAPGGGSGGAASAAQNQVPDQAKAARLVEAIPLDVKWVAVQKNLSMHRVPVWVSNAAYVAQKQLSDDFVDFIDSEAAAAYGELVKSLDLLCGEFAGMFYPKVRHPDNEYTEIPPEWKDSDHVRYRRTLADLTSASDNFLAKYQQCVNALNRKGLLPRS